MSHLVAALASTTVNTVPMADKGEVISDRLGANRCEPWRFTTNTDERLGLVGGHSRTTHGLVLLALKAECRSGISEWCAQQLGRYEDKEVVML